MATSPPLLLGKTAGAPQHEWTLVMYDCAIMVSPHDCAAWWNKATALFLLKRFEVVYQTCQALMAVDPPSNRNWEIINNLFISLQRYNEALAAFDHAAILMLDNISAWEGTVQVLINLNQFTEAIDAGDRAIALNVQNPKTWIFREVALATLDTSQAAWYYKAQILCHLSGFGSAAQDEAQERRLNQQA